jgi:phage-related protein
MSTTLKPRPKVIVARFWKAAGGDNEPVRSWLLDLTARDRKQIGGDIYRVETDWPNVGLPLVRAFGEGLFEVRTGLRNRIARVIFAVEDDLMALLHGFIKKSQATPRHDLDLAKECWDKWLKAKRK